MLARRTLTIVGRSTQSPGNVGNVLGKAKVRHLDVAIRAQQNVLRFEVSVNNVERMQVVESKRDLCSVELCDRVWEALSVSGETKQALANAPGSYEGG
jgi:hypothetical protein